MTRLRMALVGVVLVALAVAVLACLQAHRAAATDDARKDALAAAKSRVPMLLSYDQKTLDDDLKRALEQTTGSFSDDYEKILTGVVEPTAKRRGISTKASVSAAGVVSGDSDKVVVLVFLTQTTTARGGRSSVTGSRVEVTLEPSDGDWKIAGLEPV